MLILREVLGFSAREVAQSLDTTAASVNSALQRARKTVEEALPERSQQQTLRALGDDGLRGLVERYVAAWESRNVDAMVSVLVEDATFAMPPFPCWFRGRDDVVAFIAQFKPTLRHVLTSAGGQPAIAWYILDEEARRVPAGGDRGARARGRSRQGDHRVRGHRGALPAVRAAGRGCRRG